MIARPWVGRIVACRRRRCHRRWRILVDPAGIEPATAAAPPPPEVGIVQLTEADVPLPLQFAGRVAGFRVVEIRSQVSGILLKREFNEGATVNVGDVLFRIDPRTYEAALSRREAQAAQARAALMQAEENYKRVEGLVAQKVSTQKSLEDAIAARDQARAAIQSTQADVETARLNLEFTVIKAPVAGPTSLVSPPEGTLVQAQQTAADHDHPARSGLRQLHLHRQRDARAAGDQQVARHSSTPMT